MTADEIMYKGFLVVWEVLRQNQSEYHLMIEKILKLHKDNKLTKRHLEIFTPERLNMLIKIQKKRNTERFIRAIVATSNDRWERAKALNKGKIVQLRRKRGKLHN